MRFSQAGILHDRNRIKQEKTGAEAEAPILWPPDVKSQLIGKDPDAKERLRARGEGGNRG